MGDSACLTVNNIGKPYAGKPHVRFDEGGQAEWPALYSTPYQLNGFDVRADSCPGTGNSVDRLPIGLINGDENLVETGPLQIDLTP